MTWTEICQAVVAANRLNVNRRTLAASIAGCREVHLKRLKVRGVVVVGNRRSGHLHVITAEEEQECVARETNDVGHENKLHSALGFQLEPFEEESSNEDSHAGSGYGDGASEYARLRLPQAELRFEVLWKENHKTAHNH